MLISKINLLSNLKLEAHVVSKTLLIMKASEDITDYMLDNQKCLDFKLSVSISVRGCYVMSLSMRKLCILACKTCYIGYGSIFINCGLAYILTKITHAHGIGNFNFGHKGPAKD